MPVSISFFSSVKWLTVLPFITVTLHGIEVDTIKSVESLRQKLRSMARRKKVTPREVQSLTGSLNFACRAIAPGRCFLRRIIDLTRGKTRANHRIRLSVEACRNISAWLEYLHTFNGRLFFLPNIWTSSDVLRLTTYASGFAYGAVMGDQWLHMGLSWGISGYRVGFPLPEVPSILPSKNDYQSYWPSSTGGQNRLINWSFSFQTIQQSWQ